ncbi:MAG: WYL domain-containing protein [Oscillatoriales cyanobacterium SM2_1_8]|nr:WYL domain-containing protein [Oscillatoriales cyanobacterium SM2_1_8]
MPKPSCLHPYSDRQAFERLMLLVATLVRYPGIGSSDGEGSLDPDGATGLAALQSKLLTVGQELGIALPKPALPTLRKDLGTLRQYGILNRGMYRWGYYLGTGVMTPAELDISLAAMASLADFQRSPTVRAAYGAVLRRLQKSSASPSDRRAYPVRSQIDRAIVWTSLEEMAQKHQYQNNLYHRLDEVETAIVHGWAVEIERLKDPYQGNVGSKTVYPLQLLYHRIAWYLLYEHCEDQHLEIERVDRLGDGIAIQKGRSLPLAQQEQSLKAAHKLLQDGWGLYLGDRAEQALEKSGNLPTVPVKVRFFPPVLPFIEEGVARHPTQTLDPAGKPHHLDFGVKLPPRSLAEFLQWVNRFLDRACILTPSDLAAQHLAAAQQLIMRYCEEAAGDPASPQPNPRGDDAGHTKTPEFGSAIRNTPGLP